MARKYSSTLIVAALAVGVSHTCCAAQTLSVRAGLFSSFQTEHPIAMIFANIFGILFLLWLCVTAFSAIDRTPGRR